MLKQSIIVLLLSAIVILLIHQVGLSLHFLSVLHHTFIAYLNKIFSNGQTAILLKQTAALFLVPFTLSLVPTLIYYAATRKTFTYYPQVLWAFWLIAAVMVAVH